MKYGDEADSDKNKNKMKNVVICKICGSRYSGLLGLARHLPTHGITSEEYFLRFLGEKGHCQTCGKDVKFRNLIHGYQKYCSPTCSNRNKRKRHIIAEKKAQWWKEENRHDTISKISNRIKQLHRDKTSIYNQSTFRQKISELQKRRWTKWRNERMPLLFQVIKTANNAHETSIFKCLTCGKEFETPWNYVQSEKLCPECYADFA